MVLETFAVEVAPVESEQRRFAQVSDRKQIIERKVLSDSVHGMLLRLWVSQK
jgi:hypothetical protein